MISLKFSRNWDYNVDPAGDAVKSVPKGLVIQLDPSVAVAALAEGAAEPLHALPGEIVEAVAIHKRVRDLVGEGLSLEEALDVVESEVAEEEARRAKDVKASGGGRRSRKRAEA